MKKLTRVGMSTPWMGLELLQDSRPMVLPWKHPLNDMMAMLGDPGAELVMVVANSSSVNSILPPRCLSMYLRAENASLFYCPFQSNAGIRIADRMTIWWHSHLNRDEIESNLNVPGIQGCLENALYKNFEMRPLLICL